MGTLKALKSALSFLTIIPLKTDSTTIEEVARAAPIFPLVGYLTGGLSGATFYLSLKVLNPYLSSTLAMTTLVLVTGANELDGLVDFSDGAMRVGPPEKRLEAMRDPQIGVGGLAGGVFALLIQLFAWAQLASTPFSATLVYEVFGKLSMVYLGVLGHPVRPSTAESVVKHLHTGRGAALAVFSTLLCAPIIFLVGITPTLLLLALNLVCTTLLAGISRRIIGGVSGDVFGAANIITGSVSVVFVAALH
ncbi:MAG: adenosylcobinamide-GDP ribazoletransferase [Thermoprotei archaeon]